MKYKVIRYSQKDVSIANVLQTFFEDRDEAIKNFIKRCDEKDPDNESLWYYVQLIKMENENKDD